ncbi:unnamed protein product, partial [Urochloa humidicola]
SIQLSPTPPSHTRSSKCHTPLARESSLPKWPNPTTTLDRRIDPLPLTAAGHSCLLPPPPESSFCTEGVFLRSTAAQEFPSECGSLRNSIDFFFSRISDGCGKGHQPAPEKSISSSPIWFISAFFQQDINHKETFGFIGLRALSILGVGASGLLSFATIASADEAEQGLEAPSYPWPHAGILSSYDHASIRRGHQVYQQVCASCHSMSLISYRDLVGVAYTEEETKAMAAEIGVVDGPNDEGEMFTRPGKLSDRFPQPYANEQAARYANGGAYPPDLSLITKARHNGQNYVFALLTGYRDPPAGVSIREGLHYNPYFPGGAIAMPKMLMDGAVEYEDGTPATEAQMGKDVVSFLSWAAEPEMEERKLMGVKWIFLLSLALLQAAYYRRMKWSIFKSRKLVLDVVN